MRPSGACTAMANDARAAAEPAAVTALDRVQDLCATASRPVAFLGVIGMLVVSGVTVIDVLLRWFVGSGVTALNEITTMIFAVAVSACMPSGLARGVHITVDVLQPWFTARLTAWLNVAGALLLFLFFAVLGWRLYLHADNLAAQDRMTIILGLPEAPFMYAAALLFAFGAVVQAVVAANAIRRAAESVRAPSGSGAAATSSRASAGAIGVAALVAALVVYVLADFAAVSQWTQDNQGFALVIAFCAMWAMLLLLVPLAAVLGLVGLGGIATVIGFQPSLTALATEAARFLTDYQIATLPLFLMMGSFAAVAGVAGDVYRLAQAVVGSFRGGLALATIAGCAGFGTVTGSSLATIATFGQISLPEMRARGYSPALATGCVAAGGNLGALIPPSGPLILFALLTEASIGQLFIAAIIPGLLAFALYSAAVMFYVRFAPSSVPPSTRMQSSELAAALRQCGAVVVLFGAVIGGMYIGVFTATEAAAVGAFLAFLLALVRGRLRAGTFWQVMAETTASTALIYTLIFGALSFSFFVGVTSLPERLTGFIAALDVAPLVVVAIILLIYVALGCIMDSFAILVITVPVVTPLILFLGYDMVWWGIINLVIVEMSTLTPPFGIHVFVLKALVRDVPMAIIFKGVFSFVAADVVKIALLVLFPAITLWLPSTMFK